VETLTNCGKVEKLLEGFTMKPQFRNGQAAGGCITRPNNSLLPHAATLLAECGIKRWVMFLLLSCATGHGAFIGTEFAGRITGSDPAFNLRRDASVKGYFAYDPQGGRLQVAGQAAIFMFDVPEHQFRIERTSFNLGILDNFMDWQGIPYLDMLLLEFTYPGGYGAFSLSSSNLALFPNNQLPLTVPPLSAFDAGGTIYVTIDQVQPYQTFRIEITQLRPFPGLLTGDPGIVDARRTGGATSFRFLTQPSTRYTVQASDDLTETNWVTLTNVAPTLDPIVVINDVEPGSGKRFYRIRTEAN